MSLVPFPPQKTRELIMELWCPPVVWCSYLFLWKLVYWFKNWKGDTHRQHGDVI